MRQFLPAAVAVILLLTAFAGTATAAQRVGGTMVVQDGEVVGDLTTTGGTTIIRGTVDGDLHAYSGTVVIAENGTVNGRLRAYGGSVRIAGTVGENAVVYGGSVILTETGRIDNSFGAGASQVTIAGTVGGDATIGASSLTLAPTALVEGDLTYNGQLTNNGAQVDGQIRQSSDLDLAPLGPPFFGPILALYWFLATLLLGAVLLRAFPRFAETVATEIPEDPLRIAGVGLLVLVAVPMGLAIVAVTIIGLPLALVGVVGYVFALWVGGTYGRYAIGSWLLSYRDIENRWAGLVLGVLLVAILAQIPRVGLLIRFLVLLPGLGVLALGLHSVYRTVTEDRRF